MTPNQLQTAVEAATNSVWTADETDPYVLYYLNPDPDMKIKLRELPVECYEVQVKNQAVVLIAVYNEVSFD
jgi:hypothetical protein